MPAPTPDRLAGVLETVRNSIIAAAFTGVGALGAWVWNLDRTVAIMGSDAQHFVTQEEMVKFVATQTEVNRKVDVLYAIIVEDRIRGD